MDPSVRLLSDLVAIDSVNPSLVPGAAGEEAVTAAIADHLRRLGLDVHVQRVAPGRPNVIGVLEGHEPGRSLMLCGHVDTVGVEGMGSVRSHAEGRPPLAAAAGYERWRGGDD
jgi:acetylornithine deacetylase